MVKSPDFESGAKALLVRVQAPEPKFTIKGIEMLSKVDPRTFAIAAHGDQLYGGLKPYVYHLDQVADLAARYFDCFSMYGGDGVLPKHVYAVAFLHDVLEDTDVTREQLEEKFGGAIARDVWYVTDAEGINRKQRKLHTWYKIRSSRVALYIKLCDRLANTLESAAMDKHSLLGMYQKEFPLFEAALYVPNSILEPLWLELRRVTGIK